MSSQAGPFGFSKQRVAPGESKVSVMLARLIEICLTVACSSAAAFNLPMRVARLFGMFSSGY
jgi:hypothetical protein